MHILDPRRIGFALGATLSALYIGCAVMMAILPRETALHFANSLVHGIDFAPIVAWDKPWPQTVMGAFCIFVFGWLVGATFAAFYNLVGRPSPERRAAAGAPSPPQ